MPIFVLVTKIYHILGRGPVHFWMSYRATGRVEAPEHGLCFLGDLCLYGYHAKTAATKQKKTEEITIRTMRGQPCTYLPMGMLALAASQHSQQINEINKKSTNVSQKCIFLMF